MSSETNHTIFEEAKKRYENEPNTAHYRNLFNALLPYLKNAAKQQKADHFNRTLAEMHKYRYLEQTFSANQIIWCFITLLSAEVKHQKLTANEFDKMLTWLKLLNHNRPSPEHALLLRFYLKNDHLLYCISKFVDWWDIKNFRPEDYLPEPFKTITYPPLAENYFTTHSKQLLTQSKEHSDAYTNTQIQAMIDLLHVIAVEYPAYKFVPYYVVKLKLVVGADKKEMYDEFLPFARLNTIHFWVWEFLADLSADHPENHLAFLSQAMLCRGDNRMKVNMMWKLMKAIKAVGFHAEAKSLYKEIIHLRQANQWKIPPNLEAVAREEWFVNASEGVGFVNLLKNKAKHAFQLLGEGLDLVQGVINYVSDDGKTAAFATENSQQGHFRLSHFLPKMTQPGLIIDMLLEPNEISGKPPLVIYVKISQEQQNEKLKKEVNGNLRIVRPKNFALVKNIYIPGSLVVQNGFIENQHVLVVAVKSFDQKKSQWGWKAVSIKKI